MKFVKPVVVSTLLFFALAASGCGDNSGAPTEPLPSSNSDASALPNASTPSPPATPAVNVLFLGDDDSSDESKATLTISPVPTKTPTQVGGEQDVSQSAGLQGDEVMAVPPPGSDPSEYRRAIEELDRVIDLDPDNTRAYESRGDAYLSLGEYRRAIANYSRAIELDADLASAYGSRGIAYHELGDHPRALKDYDKAIELDPYVHLVYFNRALVYGSLGDHRRAIGDFDRTIELDPNDAQTYGSRGNAYLSLGNYRRAIQDYDKAIELDPSIATMYSHRAYAYLVLGEDRKAIEDLDRAYDLNLTEHFILMLTSSQASDLSYAYADRAEERFLLGEYRRAIADYGMAINFAPGDALSTYYYNRAVAYSNLVEHSQAIEDYDRAIMFDPNFVLAYLYRGHAYSLLGEQRQAIKDFDRAIKLDPALSVAYSGRGDAYFRLGEAHYDQSFTDYEFFLKIQPENTVALNNLCWYMSLAGRAAQGLAYCDRAINIDPNYFQAYDSRGLAHALLGNYEQAVEDFTKFLEWLSNQPTFGKYGPTRKLWVSRLSKGENPFDEEQLKALRSELN